MSSPIIWDILHDNTVDCIEDSATGVNSLSSININYTESEDAVNLKNVPSSIYHGKYSIQLDNINDVRNDISTGIMDFDYNVRISVAYELNVNDKSTYHDAVNAFEEIIRKRLDYESWKNTPILNIEFSVGNKFEFIANSEGSERFCIGEAVFRIMGRTNLSS